MGLPGKGNAAEPSGSASEAPSTSPEGGIQLSGQDRRRVATAVAAGTTIEYFDWMVYATFAVYFAPLMFNAADSTSALLQSAAVFAAGYLLRPLGALLIGKISDRHGRKPALTVSVAGMTTGTLLIALAPTYAQVGALASGLLVGARVLQGLSYGGEFGTAAATLREIAPPERRGRFSCIFVFASAVGQIAGFSVLLVLQNLLSPEQMSAYGWRIPFGIAMIGALAVIYLRRTMAESPVFTTTADRGANSRERGSVRALLAHHRGPTLLVFLAVAFTIPVNLTFGTYVQKFAINSLSLSPTSVSSAVLFILCLFAVTSWVWGVLGDRVGPATLLCVSIAGCAVLPVPAYLLMVQSRTAVAVALGAGAVLIFVAMFGAVQQTVLSSLFPPHLRALGAGLAQSVALALFGGTTELVALSLKAAGHESWHFGLIAVLALLGLPVGLEIRRRTRRLESSNDVAPREAAAGIS